MNAFKEMNIPCFEPYGAFYVFPCIKEFGMTSEEFATKLLQEMMTVKSDDVVGRVKIYEAMVKGKTISQAGMPESFRVLLKEFQALGLDLQVVNENDELCDIQDLEQDDEEEDTISVNEIGKELIPDEPSEEYTGESDENTEYEDEEDEFDSLDDIDYPGEEEEGEEL